MSSPSSLAFEGTERFEVRRRIGAGAMGVVYAAFDRERGAEVALKTMTGTAPASLVRFKQEFRALAGISHPNLVALHELHVDDGVWFFTMELLEGVDLLTYVRGPADGPRDEPSSLTGGNGTRTLPPGTNRGEPDLPRLRAAIAQLALGVQALHSANRLHRDIKPSNVMVTTEPRVVLLDFGIIAEVGAAAARGDVVGTPAYMAPEQADGAASPASDWYALGVVLFELLTGSRPFAGSGRAMLFDKSRYDAQPVAALAPEAPDDLASLCDALLCREPSARPSATDILRRLHVAARPDRGQASRTASGSIVGRDRDLRQLDAALERAQQGHGSQVYLSGESGMGKTALAWSFLRRARDEHGAVIVNGRCYQQESVPYKAVDSLVDTLARFLAQLPDHEADALLPRDVVLLAKVFPVLKSVEAVAKARRRRGPLPEPHELRRRAFAALRELIARIGETRPLVLFIDDLQWGDVDSAPIIDGLMRLPDPPAVVLILAFRKEDVERSALLRVLLRRRRRLGATGEAIEIAVMALDESDATTIAEGLLEAGGGDLALAPTIARESGGVPFFVHELALAACEGLASAAGAFTLQRVVATRLDELTFGERLVIELIALAAKPITERELATASELPDVELARALARLTEARFVRVAHSTGEALLECYHDRIREAVSARLAESDRRDHHVRLAGALARAADPDLEALMMHSDGAGDREAAADYACEAAAQADRALAFERSAELYTTGLELGRFDTARTRSLRTQLGDALSNAGRGGQAAESYLAAAAGAPAADRLELMRRASSAYLRSGHIDRGLDVLDQVLGEIGTRIARTPRRAMSSLVWARARLRLRGLGFRRRDASTIAPYELARLDVLWSTATDMGMVDTLVASDFATRQLLLALQLGEPSRLARGLTAEAMFLAAQGKSKRTEQVLERAAALVADIDEPELPAWLSAARGLLQYQQGRFRLAFARLEECLRHLREECTGVLWETGGIEAQSLWQLFYLGELRELSTRVDALVEQARVRGNQFDEAHFCTGLPALAWLVADRPDEGRSELASAMSRWSPRGFHLQHYYELLAQCSFDLYQGRAGAAWSRMEDTWAALRSSKLMFIPSVDIEANHLRARVALASVRDGGDASRLQIVGSARRALRKHAGNPWAYAFAALLAAGVERNVTAATDSLAHAADVCERAEMTIFAAAARRQAARCAGGAPDRVREADAAISAQGVVAPDRFSELLVPAISRPGGGP